MSRENFEFSFTTPSVNNRKRYVGQLDAQLGVRGEGGGGVKCVCTQIKGLSMYNPGGTGLDLYEFSQQFNCMCYMGLNLTIKSIIKILIW